MEYTKQQSLLNNCSKSFDELLSLIESPPPKKRVLSIETIVRYKNFS